MRYDELGIEMVFLQDGVSLAFLENLSSFVDDFSFSYFEYVGEEMSVSERFTVYRALSARSCARFGSSFCTWRCPHRICPLSSGPNFCWLYSSSGQLDENFSVSLRFLFPRSSVSLCSLFSRSFACPPSLSACFL
jgi:hypothetical protein